MAPLTLLTDFQAMSAKAKTDVRPFLKPARARDLDEWSAELFSALAENLS